MEKKLNLKSEQYFTGFKDAIREKIIELGFNEKNKINDLLEYVYEYDRLTFSKDDLSKRKRVKNAIPMQNRCSAKRANNEQCTRKRKEGCEFCGTHAKGAPHGLAEDECGVCTKPVDVVARNIMGLVYYIDKFLNVYKTTDILEGKVNPEIIAKAVIHNGEYSIPKLGLIA
jgi:hypothetical protein